MHRRLVKSLVSVFVFFFLFCSVCYAHPGGTDSDGGHTVSSTGEYHYHHGYPAHQHEDLDGDGIPDCPYDFNDKTDHASSDSSYSSVAYNVNTQSDIENIKIIDEVESNVEDEAENVTVQEREIMFIVVIIMLSVFFISSVCVIILLFKGNQRLEASVSDCSKKLSEAESINNKAKRFFEVCLSKLDKHEITGAPENEYITREGSPISEDGSSEKYKVYINPGSEVYHLKSCRHNKYGIEYDIVRAIREKYYPCSICNPRIDISWIEPCVLFEELSSIFALQNHYINPKQNDEKQSYRKQKLSQCYDVIEKAVKSSSCFAKVEYDPELSTLLLVFSESGICYKYFNFGERTFNEFIMSDSLGEYYNKKIKHNYPSMRID